MCKNKTLIRILFFQLRARMNKKYKVEWVVHSSSNELYINVKCKGKEIVLIRKDLIIYPAGNHIQYITKITNYHETEKQIIESFDV